MEYAAKNQTIPSFWLEQLGGIIEMKTQWRSKFQGETGGLHFGME